MSKGEEPFYFFTTTVGVKYKILFVLYEEVYSDYPKFNTYFYSFIFERIDKKHTAKESIIDERISHTIAAIIEKFFKKNPLGILTFVCESLDGKHKARSVLFSKWFLWFNESKKLDKIDVNIGGTYSSMIVRKNRIYKHEIEVAFLDMTRRINGL